MHSDSSITMVIGCKQASEIAIGDTGYSAHEYGEPGTDNTKSDVYAFGVLLLELLTGRKPFDKYGSMLIFFKFPTFSLRFPKNESVLLFQHSSRPRAEQSLVNWATSRLHDAEGLEEMVDHCIKKTISSKALSRFADIVSLCIQVLSFILCFRSKLIR